MLPLLNKVTDQIPSLLIALLCCLGLRCCHKPGSKIRIKGGTRNSQYFKPRHMVLS
jgi:hypothetical protein